MTYHEAASPRPAETVRLGDEPPVLGPCGPSFVLHPASRA
jgi:hypothetical protein